MSQKLFVCLIAFILIPFPSCKSRPEPTAEEVKALEVRVKRENAPDYAAGSKQAEKRWKAVTDFYQSRHFRPAWMAKGARTESANDLIGVLEQAPSHGLTKERYSHEPMKDPIDDELRLTWSLMNFGFDLAPHDADIPAIIARAMEQGSIPTLVNELAPKHAEYRTVQSALVRSLELADEGTVRRLAINLARLRKLPSELGTRYIRVNIPEYRLAVVENGSEVLSMRVVVGKEETPTPFFTSDMTHLVFSPYWNIPESILTNETLPNALEDEDYLRKQNIEVIRVSDGKTEVVDPDDIDWDKVASDPDFRFRQRPGTHNSLGLVKFMFPNEYNVYLHDTPADSLFERSQRNFSHGCVRVEQPEDLAAYLLGDQPEWTKDRILAAMQSGDEKTVKLKTRLPVHIIYLTTQVEPDGTVNLLKDIYGHDGT